MQSFLIKVWKGFRYASEIRKVRRHGGRNGKDNPNHDTDSFGEEVLRPQIVTSKRGEGAGISENVSYGRGVSHHNPSVPVPD